MLVAAGQAELVARAAYLLAKDGCRLETAFTGLDALEVLQHRHFDLVIIGAPFPDLTALEILRRALLIPGMSAARDRPNDGVATLLLVEPDPEHGVTTGSADREAGQRIAALAGGADDVLTLPCHDDELRLRAAALLRHVKRRVQVTASDVVVLGPIQVNMAAVEVTIDGCPMPLTRAEFHILCALIRRPGAWLDKSELAKTLWEDQVPSGRALIVHVSRLRGKLAGSGIDIDWVARRGYRLRVGPPGAHACTAHIGSRKPPAPHSESAATSP